jgi:HEAT repeat protein
MGTIEQLLGGLKNYDRERRKQAALRLGLLGDQQTLTPLIALLDTYMSPEAVEALAVIGIRTNAVAELVAALRVCVRREVYFADRITTALVELGNNATQALVGLLDDPSYKLRLKAVDAIYMLADPATVDPIIRVLKQETDGHVIERLFATLGHIGDQRAFAPLIDLLAADKLTSYRAAQALAQLGVRTNAVVGLVDALRACSRLGRGTEASLIMGALEKLGKASTQALISLLGDQSSAVRSNAVDVLGRIADPIAVEPLIRALKDEDRRVRDSAADQLEKMGCPASVGPLIAAAIQKLQDPMASYDSSYVSERFKKLGGAAIAGLLAALDGGGLVLQERGAAVLGKIGDRRAAEPLVGLLSVQSEAVRLAVVVALAKLGACARLVTVYESPDEHLRHCIVDGLASLEEGMWLPQLGPNGTLGASVLSVLFDRYLNSVLRHNGWEFRPSKCGNGSYEFDDKPGRALSDALSTMTVFLEKHVKELTHAQLNRLLELPATCIRVASCGSPDYSEQPVDSSRLRQLGRQELVRRSGGLRGLVARWTTR